MKLEHEELLDHAFGIRRSKFEHDYSIEEREVIDAAQSVLDERTKTLAGLEDHVAELLPQMLKDPNENWQPSDFLPDFNDPDWETQVRELRDGIGSVSDALFLVNVGDMITEEALPTYESILNTFSLFSNAAGAESAWATWTGAWTGEENRHGDLLNKFLMFTGRVDMRSIETTIQHLLRAGFDAGVGNDPYKLVMYTTFQEDATRLSHRNTAVIARREGSEALYTIDNIIAKDEARHKAFYENVVSRVFDEDPDGAMNAFANLLTKNIVMPAKNMHDGKDPDIFDYYALKAQQIGVYTSFDYANIIRKLNASWDVAKRSVSGTAAEAQEFLCTLPERYERLGERLARRFEKEPPRPVSWVYGRLV